MDGESDVDYLFPLLAFFPIAPLQCMWVIPTLLSTQGNSVLIGNVLSVLLFAAAINGLPSSPCAVQSTLFLDYFHTLY